MISTILAQKLNIGGRTIEGPLKITLPGGAENTDPKLGDIVSLLFALILPIAGLLLFFYLVAGGFNIMMSRGEPEGLEKGKKRITSALVGFFILSLAFIFSKLLGRIFGLGGGIF